MNRVGRVVSVGFDVHSVPVCRIGSFGLGRAELAWVGLSLSGLGWVWGPLPGALFVFCN